MGSVESKRPSTDPTPSKEAEQQENGHVKTNGDAPQKQNGDTVPSNGSAEPVAEEVGSSEAIEPASPVNGDPKPEEPPGKQAKKKKMFSFKKPFKLGGNPFRKAKKELPTADAPPAEAEASTPKGEEASPPAEPEKEAVEAEPTLAQEAPAPEVTASPEAIVQPEVATVPTPEETPKPVESEPITEPPTEPQKQE